MIRRVVILVSTALACLLLFSGVAAWWLLHTPSGAAWLWGRVTHATAGSLQASHLQGDLGAGFTLGELAYHAEGIEILAGSVKIRAGLDLWPPGAQVKSLVVKDVEIVSRRLAETQAGSDPVADIEALLTALRPPVPVAIHAAEVVNVTYGTGVEAPAGLLESLSFSATLNEALSIRNLELVLPGLVAGLEGRVSLEAPFDLSLAADGRLLADTPLDGLGLEAPFRLESAGRPERIGFTLVSTGDGIALGDDRFALTASGAVMSGSVQLDSVALTGPGTDLGGRGTVEWPQPGQAQLDLEIRELDLHRWLEAWPEGEYLTGDVLLAGTGQGWKIPVASLAVSGNDLAVNAEAEFDTETTLLSAAIRWESLAWPLGAAKPAFRSHEGSLDVKGNIDRWTASGEVQLEFGDYPAAVVAVEGTGDRTSASLRIIQGGILGGQVAGTAGLDWHEDLAWELDLQANGIDPEPLAPGWPGRLDGQFKAGAASASGVTRIDIAAVQGVLRGVPVRGHGGLVIRDDGTSFEGFEIQTSEALLKLDGSAADRAGVSLDFDGRLPSELLQGAAGHVRLAGQYSSAPEHAFLEVRMDARDLKWDGISVARLALATNGSADIASVPAMRLTGSGLTWQDTSLDEFSLELEPAGGRHVLHVALSGAGLAATASATLAPGEGDNPFTAPWRGMVEELVLTVPGAYRFALSEPASLQWADGSISAGPLCMRDGGGADLCVEFANHPRDGWVLSTDVVALPLDYLRGHFDLDVRFEQVLKGHLDWRKRPDGPPAGRAEFGITAGRILELEDDEAITETSEGKLGFLLRNGNLESGTLDIGFPGAGFIGVDFNVLDIADNGAQHLQGRARAQLDDLGVVGQLLLPAVDDLEGQFELDLRLGGTLAEPLFDGGFKVADGRLRYAPVGLDFQDIEIEGALDERGRGLLKGSFLAGEGTGLVDGEINFDSLDELVVDATFSGDRLLLVNTDNLTINTETDLRIRLSPQRLDINGRIVVPRARLKAADLVLEKVSDSDDLVVHGSAQGAQPAPQAVRQAVYGELEVTLGDEVVIKVPDIETRVSGTVLFTWEGQPVPIANGSYRVRGEVDVYGPRLEIANGSINFPGVPANNPLLNVRAERDIYGNTQVRSAGVNVSGSLKRPVVEAYTVPETNQDRAWSLLVTGMDYDPGQGVSGFDVGTYIAPRLYVAYGISLFEDENVLSARYDLKKGFGVKITSGTSTTGVDVSYTVDR